MKNTIGVSAGSLAVLLALATALPAQAADDYDADPLRWMPARHR